MSTLGEMLDRVRTVLRDSGPNAYVSDDDLIAWVNEAQDDLALRLELLEHTKTGTTSGNTLAVPAASTDPRLIEIVTLDLGTEDHVRFVAIDEFEVQEDAETTPSPTIAHLYNATVTFYPTPTTGTAYTLRYLALPSLLISTDDVWQLPRWTERKGIAYAQWQAKLKDEQPAIADRYLDVYEDGLPAVPTGKAAKYPGPLRIQVRGNIFDADPNARHLARGSI